MLLLNLWNSNQGDMKRESFVSTIFIVFLQIEGNLLKKYQCTFLKRVPSIFRINIEIVLTKDYRFMSPWLLFRKFIFPSVKLDSWRRSILYDYYSWWDGIICKYDTPKLSVACNRYWPQFHMIDSLAKRHWWF